MSFQTNSQTKPIPTAPTSKKGLTIAGVIVMQTIVIAGFTSYDLFIRKGTGILTGVAICLATFGTIRFARAGTEYVSAATAPLAFATAAVISLIAIDGIHPSRLGVGIVAALASAAPYLLFSATFGWINFLRSRMKAKNLK